MTPSVVATGQLTASTVLMVPIVLLLHGPQAIMTSSLPIWAAVGALAIFSTALAFILYFNIIASAGAINASLVTLLVPVSAILLGAALLGERLEPFEFIGMALIMASLIIIDGRAFSALNVTQPAFHDKSGARRDSNFLSPNFREQRLLSFSVDQAGCWPARRL
jgi:drug/metabolite transporter (DMT)-like permease